VLQRLLECWQPSSARVMYPTDDPDRQHVEFAWHLFDTASEHSARLDLKSSIVLTVETAAVFAVFAAGDGKFFDHLHGPGLVLFRIAVVFLLLAVVLAAFVVVPAMRLPRSKLQYWQNSIDYQNLRHWDATELRGAIVKTCGSDISRSGSADRSRVFGNHARPAWRP
jgi:hypothetical protein